MRDFKRASKMLSRLLIALVVGTGLSFGSSMVVPQEASAQSRSFEEGRPVRRQLLYRSSRVEIAPSIGGLFGNGYQIPFYIGVSGSYHLTNSLALGIDINGSPVALDRKVVDDISPELRPQISIADTPLLTNFHVSYAPIVGKMNAFKNKIAHFDVHFIAGVGGALQTSENPALQGFEFGAVVGVGARIFIDDGIALFARFTDYIYSNAEAARELQTPEEKWRNHFYTQVGVSFFLPGQVYVSR
jgi:outer membrane beta-barrel protein